MEPENEEIKSEIKNLEMTVEKYKENKRKMMKKMFDNPKKEIKENVENIENKPNKETKKMEEIKNETKIKKCYDWFKNGIKYLWIKLTKRNYQKLE